MRPDGHCGFRAIAHAILKCQDDWNDIRTSLLNHLESYGENDANPYVLAVLGAIQSGNLLIGLLFDRNYEHLMLLSSA